MTPMSLVYAAAMAVFVALALMVLLRNPKSPLAWTSALLLSAFAVWSFEDIAHGNPTVSPQVYGNIGALGWTSFPSLFMLFVLFFTRRKRLLWFWPTHVILFGVPLAFIYLQWTGHLMHSYVRHDFGWTTRWSGSVWPLLYFLYYFGTGLVALAFLVRFGVRTTQPAERRQARVIAVTGTIALVLGTLSDVLLPNFIHSPLPELAGVFNLIWGAGLYLSITRYGLLSLTPAAAAADILTAMSDALLLLTLEGRIVTMNQGAEELFGCARTDLAGRSAEALFAQRSDFHHAQDSVLTSGSLRLEEIACITRDGRSVPASASIRVLRERGGIVTGIVWVLRDIRERKRAEDELRRAHEGLELRVRQRTAELANVNRVLTNEVSVRRRTELALRESERRYRELADSLPQPVYEMDAGGRLVFVNACAYRLFGYSEEDFLTGLNALQMIAPRDRDRATANVRRALAGELLGGIEYVGCRKDGTPLPVMVHASRIIQDGRTTGLRGVIFDLSDIKRAEEALRQSEQRYRRLTENMSDVVWLADMTLTLTYISPVVTQLFGYTVEEMLAMPTERMMTPPSFQHLSGLFFAWLAGELAGRTDPGRVQVAEVEYVCKDGSTRWAEIRVSALRDAQGQPTALLGVTRDIAERRRAEEELRKYREHLEELVAERTHALEQAQEVLLRKERLAAVGQLAGSIAHEIRNPLGIIRNAIYFLETAARDQLADKPARYLTIIRQEVERTEQIVSSLLDYARARAPNRARCALADIVAAALDRAAPPPGVVVESSLPPDLPRVIVDSAQLVQSLLNLVTNAVQAMDQQGRLHIRARVAPEGVELSIADSGPGISAADLPRVFEPLFSTRSLGTGLGLAITRAFVEANGGHINVRSEPGQGAEFTLVLPAAAD